MSRRHRFQMTYPYEGEIIESNSLKRAVRECYHQYKQTEGLPEGLFSVTDLDTGIEYQFQKRRHKKIKRIEVGQVSPMGGGGDPLAEPEEKTKTEPRLNHNGDPNGDPSADPGLAPVVPEPKSNPGGDPSLAPVLDPVVPEPTIPQILPSTAQPTPPPVPSRPDHELLQILDQRLEPLVARISGFERGLQQVTQQVTQMQAEQKKLSQRIPIEPDFSRPPVLQTRKIKRTPQQIRDRNRRRLRDDSSSLSPGQTPNGCIFM